MLLVNFGFFVFVGEGFLLNFEGGIVENDFYCYDLEVGCLIIFIFFDLFDRYIYKRLVVMGDDYYNYEKVFFFVICLYF